MALTRAASVLAAAGVAAGLTLSGGVGADPPIPRGFPGPIPSFFRAEAADDQIMREACRRERRWLGRGEGLGAGVPRWARRLYERSLLVLRALVDPRSGGAVAGAPAGWAYVWPRDAGAVAIALAESGYGPEARRIARFLIGLDLGAAARFHADGEPIEGREAQGDAAGWVAVAARAAGVPVRVETLPWRDRADYQEKEPGEYLANAISYGVPPYRLRAMFAAGPYLVRRAGDPDSGLDSAAAWAVQPFARPRLFPLVRRTLLRLAARSGRFGLLPSEDWDGGEDPWTAPTAWTAWSLAALGERAAALHLMTALRRAATPLGLLPERVDAHTGAPSSTTPLAWSHAFTILALRELWPPMLASHANSEGDTRGLRGARPQHEGRRR